VLLESGGYAEAILGWPRKRSHIRENGRLKANHWKGVSPQRKFGFGWVKERGGRPRMYCCGLEGAGGLAGWGDELRGKTKANPRAGEKDTRKLQRQGGAEVAF